MTSYSAPAGGSSSLMLIATSVAELVAAEASAFAAGGGTIQVETPIALGATVVTLRDQVVLRCVGKGALTTTGNGGIVFDSQQNTWGSIVRIRRGSIGWNTTDATSVGVTLRNCQWGKYEVAECQNFHTGILMSGDGTGTALNTLVLGRINDNKIGRRSLTANGGYVNSNTYVGGVVRISNFGGTVGSRYLDIGASNNETFFGIDLEGSAPERTVDITSGVNNVWVNARWESATGVWFGASSSGNRLVGGYGLARSLLHDSAPLGANIIDIGSGEVKRVVAVGGSYVVNGVAYVNLDSLVGGSATDIVIHAETGQWVELGACLAWQNEAEYGFIDVVTVLGGNYVSGAGAGGHGITAWVGTISQLARTGGSIPYQVQAADIALDGTVTFRLRVKTLNPANKTLLANANDPLVFWARNLG